jgi:7-cyano-7-deazaguanine synthase
VRDDQPVSEARDPLVGARTAVLFSAGLDSAVLAVSEARSGPVQPIYVSGGLAWEGEEMAAAERLLRHPAFTPVLPLATLTFSVRDLYPESHWALRGVPPAFDTPDEDVYLAGRNIALLSKSAIYCAAQGISRIAMGPLAGNPFPDATPQFFEAMAAALSMGLAHPTTIAAPFAALHKPEVIRLGAALGVPLELTISCMNPKGGRHCGRCSKCRERRHAFRDSGIADATAYEADSDR